MEYRAIVDAFIRGTTSGTPASGLLQVSKVMPSKSSHHPLKLKNGAVPLRPHLMGWGVGACFLRVTLRLVYPQECIPQLDTDQ